MPIWRPLLPTVGVFGLCDISGIGAGMGGLFWTGIDLPVIESACRLCGISRSDRREVAEDVRFMGQVVATTRNKRSAAESERHAARRG